MDRYFLAEHGKDRRDISPLDRLAYMADKGMGALEYRPVIEHTADENDIDLAQLYQAANAVSTKVKPRLLWMPCDLPVVPRQVPGPRW